MNPRFKRKCTSAATRWLAARRWELSARRWALACGMIVGLSWMVTLCGCDSAGGERNEQFQVLGRRGIDPGRFIKPRGITHDQSGNLYVVDMTARIQVLDATGNYLRHWQTPEFAQGKPCGLSMSHDGLVMVADTHYFRILFYTPEGQLVPERTIGGENGRGPGQFGFVTDVVQDVQGNYYVSEYGDYDRIQKFDPQGKYVCEWGGHGSAPGEFLRPQGLAMDDQNHLWVADASNHRIQIFDVGQTPPKFLRQFGEFGDEPGQFRYPYSIVLDPNGQVIICEFGNHRLQRFTRDGKFLATTGQAGREPGCFHQPWGLTQTPDGTLHILDSYNHRLQSTRW